MACTCRSVATLVLCVTSWIVYIRTQDEEDSVDTIVKMLMETESRCKEQTQQFDHHYERWTSLCQVWFGYATGV